MLEAARGSLFRLIAKFARHPIPTFLKKARGYPGELPAAGRQARSKPVQSVIRNNINDRHLLKKPNYWRGSA
jgi:hypothetical protein